MATKMSNQSGNQQSGNFPLDNVTFDLVTLTYEKSKGLEAFDKYIKDAQGNQQVLDLFQRMRQQDEQFVNELRDCLAQMLSGQQTGEQQGAQSKQMASGQSSGASASGGRSGAQGKGTLAE